MPIHFVKGDICLTGAQSILLGLNARGQADVNPLETTLRDQHPVFFSEYRRMARNNALPTLWVFRESQPWFIGVVLRDSARGIVRLRLLEQALTTLRLEWQREGLESIAVAPLGDELEWPALKGLLEELLIYIPIPIFVYEEYIPGQKADEAKE